MSLNCIFHVQAIIKINPIGFSQGHKYSDLSLHMPSVEKKQEKEKEKRIKKKDEKRGWRVWEGQPLSFAQRDNKVALNQRKAIASGAAALNQQLDFCIEGSVSLLNSRPRDFERRAGHGAVLVVDQRRENSTVGRKDALKRLGVSDKQKNEAPPGEGECMRPK